eukprot:scaffold2704_cov159-Amphora_coffeaeformis.AAC.4
MESRQPYQGRSDNTGQEDGRDTYHHRHRTAWSLLSESSLSRYDEDPIPFSASLDPRRTG